MKNFKNLLLLTFLIFLIPFTGCEEKEFEFDNPEIEVKFFDGDITNPETYIQDCIINCGLGHKPELEGIQVKDIDPDSMPVYAIPSPEGWIDQSNAVSALNLDASNEPYWNVYGYAESRHEAEGLPSSIIWIGDTGVWPHAEFAGRLVAGKNYVGDEDNGQHGSHCAGCAAGANTGSNAHALISDRKVLLGRGSGSRSTITTMMRDYEAQDEAKVLSLSLGGPGESADQREVLRQINSDDSKFVTISAGNSGNGDGVGSTVLCPACYFKYEEFKEGGVIIIGASGIVNGKAQMASFSSSGENQIGTVGFGVRILAPISIDLAARLSGTSMGNPTIAGKIAEAQSKFKAKGKVFRHEHFWKAIRMTNVAIDIHEGNRRDGFGHLHYAYFSKAIDALLEDPDNPDLPPPPPPVDPEPEPEPVLTCKDLDEFKDWISGGSIVVTRAQLRYNSNISERTLNTYINNVVLRMIQNQTRKYKYVKPVLREGNVGVPKEIKGVPMRVIQLESEDADTCTLQILGQFEVLFEK